jgi:predicted porin
MKKTIIASAIAAVVAAPAAFADVSISGQINQEFIDRSGQDLNSDLNSDIGIKGSEDLGNGMKASFVIHQVMDDGAYAGATGTAAAQTTADQSITLSGDFGAVTFGRFEPMTESKGVSIANIDHSDALDLESTLGNGGRAEGGFKYVSPSFNGLTVTLEGQANSESATSDNFDTTSVGVEYSNGGLYVVAISEDTSATVDQTTFGVKYKMGDIELRAVTTEQDTSGTKVDHTFYGAKYTMGANSVAVGMVDSDGTDDGDNIISVGHSLSKRTGVYLTHKSNDDSQDQTLVGIKHSF